MRFVTFLLATTAAAVILGGCLKSAPRETIPASTVPEDWIKVDAKTEPVSIYLPKGWTATLDSEELGGGTSASTTVIKAVAPRSNPHESVAAVVVSTMPNPPDVGDRALGTNDLNGFVHGATNGDPSVLVRKSAIVSLPCGEALYLDRTISVPKGSETVPYEGYLYAVPHSGNAYLVAITIPQKDANRDDLQRSIIATLKIRN